MAKFTFLWRGPPLTLQKGKVVIVKELVFTEYDFLCGFAQDLKEMKMEMESYDLTRLKDLGKTCLRACPSEPLPVGSLNIIVTKEDISFKDIDAPFNLDVQRTRIVLTEYNEVLTGLFMLLAVLLDKRWNFFIAKKFHSVFELIMSSLLYFLTLFEEEKDYEIRIKDIFFEYLFETVKGEMKCWEDNRKITRPKNFIVH